MGDGSCALGGRGPLILGGQHWREGWVQVRTLKGGCQGGGCGDRWAGPELSIRWAHTSREVTGLCVKG